MRRRRKIKILATLGPASNNSQTIEQLFRAGADIFRINMSHTSHDEMRALVAAIRAVEPATAICCAGCAAISRDWRVEPI